jgi:hypothetical protein
MITLSNLTHYVVVSFDTSISREDCDKKWLPRIGKIAHLDKKNVALQFHNLYFEFRDAFAVINSKWNSIFNLIEYSYDEENYLALGLGLRSLFESLGSLSHILLSTRKVFLQINKSSDWSKAKNILDKFNKYRRVCYGSSFFTTDFNRIHVNDLNGNLLELVPGLSDIIVGRKIDENNVHSLLSEFVHPNFGSNVIVGNNNKLEIFSKIKDQSKFFRKTLSEIAPLLVWVSIRLKLIFGMYTLYFWALKDHLCHKERSELDNETIRLYHEGLQPKIWCSPANPGELISLNFDLREYFPSIPGDGKSKEKPIGWIGRPELQEKMIQDNLDNPLVNKPGYWSIRSKREIIEDNYMYTIFPVVNKNAARDVFWFKRPYFRLDI